MDSVNIPKTCRLYSQDSFNCNLTNFIGLFIIGFNIRSINKNGWKFSSFIDGLNKKPNVIVLSETWVNETNNDSLPGKQLMLLVFIEHLLMMLEHVSYLKLKK